MRERRASYELPTYALIVCATLLAYLPAFNGTLVWDDAGHITRPDLRSLQGLVRIWTNPHATQQYYPLLHTAFWVEHHLWGDSVLFYHLLNVTLHALAACLLVKIVRRLSLPGAWLAGLLFALHPVCVEAVAWISEQKSTLSGALYFAAALAYLKFDESRRRNAYATALALFAAALLAKTVTAVLPAVLLTVLWWRRGRIEWRRDVVPLLPWFTIGAAAGLYTARVESTLIGARGVEFALTPVQRILLAGRAIWFYAGKFVWPVDLAFFYPRWTLAPAVWWQWLFPVVLLAVAAGLAMLARRRRGPLAALLVFVATLFPALGFFNVYPFRYSFVADHFAYLAAVAIIVPAAAYLSRIPYRAGAIAAIPLAVLTWQQASTYRDEETLYRATIEHNPGAWLAHNNLANLLLATPGGRAEAMSHIETALRLNPDFAEAHITLGNALLHTPGRLEDAIAEYRTAARLAPNSERAHTNLGYALLQAGRIDEAVAELEHALRIDPGNAEAHNDLGNAFWQLGRLPDAIAQYRVALETDGEFAEAYNNLGRALAATGNLPDAIKEFQTAIWFNRNSWSAHSNLGNALSMMPGRLSDAIAEYRAALRLNPDFAPAHNNLGFALSHDTASLPAAISEYREAIRLAPNFTDAHYNLGAALLQMNQRAEALVEFETVLRLKPNSRVEEIVRRLRGGE